LLILVAAPAFAGDPISATFGQPALDRWMYAFASTPGAEGFTRLFGAFDNPAFDNRDGQMYVRFDTAAQVPTGLDPARYQIVSAVVTIQNTEDKAFFYDDTLDPYGVFLAPSDPDFVEDEDPGQPIELFGAGFRNGYTAATFAEDGPFASGDPLQQNVRNVYAASHDAAGTFIDVSTSVVERFDPVPWAIGHIEGLTPGDLVPIDSQIVLDINVADPHVHAYLAAALADGRLPLTITSLHIVEFMGGSYPKIYTKENALVQFGIVDAARLQLVVEIVDVLVGDLDGDGDVDGFDLAILLAAWGRCDDPAPGSCPEDLDGNGVVNGFDLAMLLAAWSTR
jgi:hypothetical protein